MRMMSIDNIKSRTRDHAENLKFVYKTHYKMGEWYERFDRLLTLLVVAGTGLLTALLIWDATTRPVLLTVAVTVAIISWASAAFDFGKKSEKHYSAADEYHSLYEDFRDFYLINIENENIEPYKRFNELVKRRRRLKDKTPRTTSFWHNRLNSQDIRESIKNDLQTA